MAGVGEPVAAPQRFELVAPQPPGADDGVARVVGDDDPAARDPIPAGSTRSRAGSPLISTERTRAVVAGAPTTAAPGSTPPPLPSIVRSVRLRPLSIQKTCSSVITGSQP